MGGLFIDNINFMSDMSEPRFKNELKPKSEIQSEFVAYKEKNPKALKNSGLSWLLIVLVLVLSALSVSMFRPSAVDTPGLPGQSSIGTSLEPTPDTRQPRVYTISYRNGVFSPTNLRIHAGDTVRFKNESVFPIRIVGDDLVGFDSVGDIPQGSFFAFTFL